MYIDQIVGLGLKIRSGQLNTFSFYVHDSCYLIGMININYCNKEIVLLNTTMGAERMEMLLTHIYLLLSTNECHFFLLLYILLLSLVSNHETL